MAGLRRLDAFSKTRPELQQKSAVGGIITAIAATSAAILFFAQIFWYVAGSTQHSLHLARSTSYPVKKLSEINPKLQKGRVPLSIHVTFPHMECSSLDVTLDGASLSSGELEKHHGVHSVTLRLPTGSDRSHSHYAFQAGHGCTVIGKLRPLMVAGVLAISVSQSAWLQATHRVQLRPGNEQKDIAEQLQQFNISHYIHDIQFGKDRGIGIRKPLRGRANWIKNEYGGIAVEYISVKLIPTVVKESFSEKFTYQMSVSDHTINPETLVTKGVPYLPGLVLNYDFAPLALYHFSGRDNIFVFLSSLVSIVGGVFVTVGLLTGCLVHSAQAVAKKID